MHRPSTCHWLRIGAVRWHRVAAVLFATALSPGCSDSRTASALEGQPPKRVIWIAVDSLRADHLGAWGYGRDTSPWMDSLAGRSVTFSWAVSPANGTLKSVAGYFSGKPFTQLGNPYENAVPEAVVTLAESLTAAGARCTAFTTNITIAPARGYAQGFADYRVIATPSKVHSDIEELIADVREHYRPGGGPEFVYLHTMDVHSPYRPPSPYGWMFTRPYSGETIWEGNAYVEDRSNNANSLHPFWSQLHNVSQDDIEFLAGLYDGAIRYTDARLPALLDALDWDPERDVLILTADHGEALYEHGWWGHFGTLAPTEIHVPLIMNYAGFTHARIDTPVSLLDLYPTILELFGAPLPEGLMGVSLVPALTGGSVAPHDVYSETSLTYGAKAALVFGDFWYVLSGNRSQFQPWHAWPYEEFLYGYKTDPQGLENAIQTQSQAADDLNARLRAFNPFWAEYTRERLRGDDETVSFGPNLLRAVPDDPAGPASVAFEHGAWRLEPPFDGLQFEAKGLTPYEPVFLEIPYALEAGRIRVTLGPAEYRWPGTARPKEIWEHVCTRPGESQLLAATIVPLSESLTLRITATPGTRARISIPTLRSIEIDRIDPWPRAPKNSAGDLGADASEVQRLKALGYL